jgi:hypothetical protein
MGVSGFLISCARRRATSAQAAERCADTTSVMSSKTIRRCSGGSTAPRTMQGQRCPASLHRCRVAELERLLPLLRARRARGCCRSCSKRWSTSRAARLPPARAPQSSRRPRQAASGSPQDARGTGVEERRCGPARRARARRRSALSRMVCSRVHARRRAGPCCARPRRAHSASWLGHVGKRARQAAPVRRGRAEHGLGRQIARCHLAHALGQHQQGSRQLLAQQDGQQHGAEDRQEQRSASGCRCTCGFKPSRAERALLIFAVGRLHRQGVGDQAARAMGCTTLQAGGRRSPTRPIERALTAAPGRGCAAPRRPCAARDGVVQPFDRTGRSGAACLAQQHHAPGRCGAQRVSSLRDRPALASRLPEACPTKVTVARAQLRAQLLQRQRASWHCRDFRPGARRRGRVLATWLPKSRDWVSSRACPCQRQARRPAPLRAGRRTTIRSSCD